MSRGLGVVQRQILSLGVAHAVRLRGEPARAAEFVVRHFPGEKGRFTRLQSHLGYAWGRPDLTEALVLEALCARRLVVRKKEAYWPRGGPPFQLAYHPAQATAAVRAIDSLVSRGLLIVCAEIDQGIREPDAEWVVQACLQQRPYWVSEEGISACGDDWRKWPLDVIDEVLVDSTSRRRRCEYRDGTPVDEFLDEDARRAFEQLMAPLAQKLSSLMKSLEDD